MIRGRKPKPTQLKLVTGNPGGRPIPKGEPDPGGKPIKPKWLKGRGATLWSEVMGFAFWLTQADSYKLAAWCDRQADFENNREHWTAADRREHRSAHKGGSIRDGVILSVTDASADEQSR